MADAQSIWRLLRRKGVRPALVAAGSLLVFGVVNNLTEGAVSTGADYVRGRIRPPSFVVSFSRRIAPHPTASVSRIETGEAVAINRTDDDALVVGAGAGNYRLKLQRGSGTDVQVLPTLIAVKAPGEMVKLDTGDGNWESVAALAKVGDASYSAAPSPSMLSDTRWIVGDPDREQAKMAATPLTARIVTAALAEVGLSEDGPIEQRQRIARYWSSTPLATMFAASVDGPILPWGGVILGYVVAAAGAEPPVRAAEFESWRAWGAAVPAGAEAPGDILVFSMVPPGRQRRLMAGVMIRRLRDCMEVVAGNIGNRSVITCVHRPPLAARRATA